MVRLTSDERQRVFRARQSAARETLARLVTPGAPAAQPRAPARRLRQVAAVGMIGLVLGGAWLTSQWVALHRPASLAEALWPRL
jgi:hypothetical protein